MGFYYLNDRYYDSVTGRFLTADDVSYLGANGDLLGYNLYAYCSNNPIMYVDPTGHSIIACIVVLGIATLIGAIASGIYSYYEEEERGWDLAKDILLGGAAGLALGGAGVALGAVVMGVGVAFGVVSASATILGVTIPQAFAIGALAVNFWTYIVLPMHGEEEDGIEVEEPVYKPVTVQPTVPHPAWK